MIESIDKPKHLLYFYQICSVALIFRNGETKRATLKRKKNSLIFLQQPSSKFDRVLYPYIFYTSRKNRHYLPL